LRNNEVLEKALLEVLHTLWPQTKNASLDSKWTGVLGIGLSREPIVARVQSGCVAAVKMGGMGVAIGMQIGQDSVALLLSD
jgi:glycine/D-amino acid oxidase-like deaminating enzyme